MVIFIVLALIFMFVYLGLPKWAQVVLLVANIFIPDPIPFVDEVVMAAITCKGIFY